MNYALEGCILNINLTLIVSLERITIVTKANPIIYGKLFLHILADTVMLLNFLADINKTFFFFALGSAPFKV